MMRAFAVSMRWLVIATITAIATQVAVSQAPPKESRLDVTINKKSVHNIDVGNRTASSFLMQVTDSMRKPVGGLTIKDVTVKKDSESVRVTRVLRLGDAPFVSNLIVLVLDNSSSIRLSCGHFAEVPQGIRRFFRKRCRSGPGALSRRHPMVERASRYLSREGIEPVGAGLHHG